jgi:hypothetical protein
MHAPLSRFVEPTYAIMCVVVGFLFAFSARKNCSAHSVAPSVRLPL